MNTLTKAVETMTKTTRYQEMNENTCKVSSQYNDDQQQKF